MAADLVVASNRGLTLEQGDDGRPVATQGGGGLASSLGPLLRDSGATWVAAAMTDTERALAPHGRVDTDGFGYRAVAIEPDTYRLAYDVVANETLWFLYHRLFDLPRGPVFDREWRIAWRAYEDYNAAIAEAIMEEAAQGATVLVHDYHLALVGSHLSRARPDLKTAHFSHTPLCEPADIAVLPHDVATALLEGMASFGACGFHTRRWASEFELSCEAVLGRRPPTFVAPLAPDPRTLQTVGGSAACAAAGDRIERTAGGCKLIVRADRIEPSKNILRGFEILDELLRAEPSWVENVVFVAYVYPSRSGVPAYRAYRVEMERLVRQINARWRTPKWKPIILDTLDSYPRSVAALQRYDVLMVNVMRDGLNLVAKEGPILNGNDGVVLLSRDAGAWDELHDHVLTVDPFDVGAGAAQLKRALEMGDAQRKEHAVALRAAVVARDPRAWLEDQIRNAR